MYYNRRLVKKINKFYKLLSKKILFATKKQIIWLLRTLFVPKRRRETINAGFVLPTVVMVSLVVVLLTTAIMFRSFDRSKNASNVRVNQAVLNAAIPAIDRSRAKLNKLFQSPQLPRATPTDTALQSTLTTNIDDYTFGDETKLNVTYNSDKLQTAWTYPVDTNNNGKFDSYTIYGIYFNNPPVKNGNFTSARNPLEARTPPMAGGNASADCGDTLGTSATLVGSTGWFHIGSKLKKSFFVYTATVPITNPPTSNNNYESFQGNKGFSAIEYEQDRVQLPLVNNAVIYEDDISLAPGPAFNLNGRIFTNSNFITGGGTGVSLYQVSSINSCFYEEDNSHIVIGGNLGAGGFTDTSDLSTSTVVHLYQGKGVSPDQTPKVTDNKSANAVPADIAYNSLAYVQRINRLIDAQIANDSTGANDPQEVKDGISNEKVTFGLTTYTTDELAQIRHDQLELYFKKHTRRVPYKEVVFGGDALGDYSATAAAASAKTPLQGSVDTLRPIDAWIYPTDPTDGTTATNYAGLALNPGKDSTKILPQTTEPTKLQKQLQGIDQFLGDRASVGNNLPELWWDKNQGKFVGPDPQDTQNLSTIVWDDGNGTRTRRSQVQQLADLGATDRDKDWELAAAQVPANPQDPVGGLRVVTGAGIYLPSGYTVDKLATDFTTALSSTNRIWSDMMPVASKTATTNGSTNDTDIVLPTNTPYLRMRATAVYHYASDKYDQKNPTPIACVSSYYDPTDNARARNIKKLADVSPLGSPNDNTNDGSSNNGIVYDPPSGTTDTYKAVLNYQTQLQYPNGRLVNEILKDSLAKDASKRTLSQQSAVDAALCTLQILDGSIKVQASPVIPHGAIMETAFLDARQIKAIHKDQSTAGVETFTNADGVNGDGTVPFAQVPSAADYSLPIEQRQPLEIRATVLNINSLRSTKIGSGTPQEYLLPNSGIIYATRDDALSDLSASKPSTGSDIQKQATQNSVSPVDFILDPTRRPNAIMLINGSKIWREQNYRDAEKGLILASNLPAYIKGDFNLHTQQEFTEALKDDWTNFYSRPKSGEKRNVNFACRPNDARLPNCKTGDDWRPASVLADAITLLSNSFQPGLRSDGDYDLNNNLGDTDSVGKFQQNGFFTNTYVTNAPWYDGTSTDYPNILSSYLNNFVTPIQRRGTFNEYLMEVCPKLPVSACQPTEWIVKPSTNSWNISGGIVGKSVDGATPDLQSGTTDLPAATAYQRYPRRVAFKRDSNGNLVLTSGIPTPLGIKSDGTVAEFSYGSGFYPRKTTIKGKANNALWFKTTTKTSSPTTDDDSTTDVADQPLLLANDSLSATPQSQPRLLPVLQIYRPSDPSKDTSDKVGPANNTNLAANWLQPATETTFNLVAAAGDTPARPTEDNGGLHNFVRFVENWNATGQVADATKARINGSFIQFKRSAYATGPFRAFLTTGSSYPIAGNSGKAPFYLAPSRQWGYDVGLLSQSPDLFAQKLVRTPDDLPDEYFREVSRDDTWVQTLLCAQKNDGGSTYAIDKDQRPSSCQ